MIKHFFIQGQVIPEKPSLLEVESEVAKDLVYAASLSSFMFQMVSSARVRQKAEKAAGSFELLWFEAAPSNFMVRGSAKNAPVVPQRAFVPRMS